MATLIIDEEVAKKLHLIAEREQRPIDDVLRSMVESYEPHPITEPDEALEAFIGMFDDDVTDLSTTVRETRRNTTRRSMAIPNSPHPPTPSPSGRGGEEHSSSEFEAFHEDAVYREMASKVMVQVARSLRQRHTNAEIILWEALRKRQLAGLKFRRQHPIPATAYVVDFLCYDSKLVIEIDGKIHQAQVEDDLIRQQNIEAHGYRFLRLTNQQILDHLETVLITILQHSRRNSPLPEGEGSGVRAHKRDER